MDDGRWTMDDGWLLAVGYPAFKRRKVVQMSNESHHLFRALWGPFEAYTAD